MMRPLSVSSREGSLHGEPVAGASRRKRGSAGRLSPIQSNQSNGSRTTGSRSRSRGRDQYDHSMNQQPRPLTPGKVD